MKNNPFWIGQEIKLYPDWAANFIKNSLIYDTYNGHCLDSKRLRACTKMTLQTYFQSLRTVLLNENGTPRFKKWNIWNLDETNNQTRGKAKTVDFKGVDKSIKREPVRPTNTTFTFCVSAAGKSCTVQMIHKGVAVPIEYVYLNKGLNIVVVTTKSGWQTKISFEGF
jgi:hypothetical protein